MTYNEVLSFLYGQLPMYQRQGKTALKKDLSNTIALCSSIGNPQHRFPSIHIAGTNGKGSTAHMISAILQAAGLKVGLYTSPHYKDYRERIKINGRLIKKQSVINFITDNHPTILAIAPSFFELTVAMAFDYFSRAKVDIAVIETGLGGRLDSTNVVNPLIAVITNIGYDHQAILGNTLDLIAKEKAGIIKPNTPVIIGRRQSETEAVFSNKAESNSAELAYADDLLDTKVLSQSIDQTSLEFNDVQREWRLKVSLPSGIPYNVENCKTAIATIVQLRAQQRYSITDQDIQNGISAFPQLSRYIGRWQIKNQSPLTILDAAHNEEGISLLFQTVSKYHFNQLHIVLGMVSDKDSTKMLKLFPKSARYYYCQPDVPRAKNVDELRSKGLELQLLGRKYSSVKNALKAARRAAGPDDLILATGSSFVVAELV